MASLVAQWNDMVSAVEPVVHKWFDYAEPHPSTRGFPLTDLNTSLLLIVGYVVMLVVGIPVMKSVEKPFQLKGFKLFHNLFLFALSAYMCGETIRQAILGNYSLFGNDIENGDEPHAKGMARIVYIFYISKYYEFVDTLIMVLCKKFNQVSVLHVYHHLSIALVWHFIARYAPGGDAYFSVILNSFVHTVMYGYYLASSQGITVVKVIKPYITTLQMTQFVCMLIQSIYDTIYPCKYPVALVKLLGWYMISLLILFGNFFVQSYLKKPKNKKTKTN
jgi:elongation of very long chain fatty acids protein 4